MCIRDSYLGDHDPSGIDMSRDVDDRLRLFTYGVGVTVHRIALNMDQVKTFNPPPNPAKITDSRASGYIKKFGKKSWELDAIEPKKLAQLVIDKINSLTDPKKWGASGKIQEAGRKELHKFADNYGNGKGKKGK